MTVFDQFGTPGDVAEHRVPFEELVADLGIDTYEKRLSRRNLVRQAIPTIWAEVEAMIAENPRVKD